MEIVTELLSRARLSVVGCVVVVVLGGARVCSHVSTSGRGRDDLSREGQARQDKADAQRDAGKKGAEAESGRAGADAAEERQKKNQ